MQLVETIVVNLDLPPNKRWDFVENHRQSINELIACYWKDIEDYLEFIETYLEVYKKQFIPTTYLEEIKCLSQYCDFSENQLLIVNLYYDIIKLGFACTAFAFEKDGTIWHARNLDWWTENQLLSTHTKIFDWQKDGQTVFKSVGWIGFIGVLSGMKPNRFSVTLNAVLSEEQPSLSQPISFLLREVLERDNSFEQAKQVLEQTNIVCDCLLLLSGTQKDEMLVIERTPMSSAIRRSENGYIMVTNDYKVHQSNESRAESILSSTSCGRYDRVNDVLKNRFPNNSQSCFDILNDEQVKMNITVQQMVFNAGLDVLEAKMVI